MSRAAPGEQYGGFFWNAWHPDEGALELGPEKVGNRLSDGFFRPAGVVVHRIQCEGRNPVATIAPDGFQALADSLSRPLDISRAGQYREDRRRPRPKVEARPYTAPT